MSMMTNEQVLACQREGLSATETGRLLGVSQSAVDWRAKKLRIKFVSKQGQGKRRPWQTCLSCKQRKLCLLCHRLHVAALPCEIELTVHGINESDPQIWPHYYARLLPKFAKL